MKRAGISLALVVMLLLGAAVQAQAEETGLAAEAESFYRSVLAAKDRETLQTYLDCFSDQRRVELRAELPATLRQGLDTVLQQMKLPSITPVEENTQQKETGWQLDASTTWDDAAGSYTLRLETSSEAGGADAVIRYTLASELDAGSARLQYWAVDKTPQGWSKTMQNCPKVAAALDNGGLTASGFDFTTGKKLVVQLAGLQPARGSSFGGQGIPVGEGGVLQTVHETDYMVRYPAGGMDLPLNAPCFPVDQTIQDGQAAGRHKQCVVQRSLYGNGCQWPGDGVLPRGGRAARWRRAVGCAAAANLPPKRYPIYGDTDPDGGTGCGRFRPKRNRAGCVQQHSPGICAAVIICNRQKPARQSKLLCGLCAVLHGKLWSGPVFGGKNMLQ